MVEDCDRNRNLDWRKFVPFLLIAAVVLVYGNSFTGGFVFDDGHAIVHNERLRGTGSLWSTVSLPRRWLVDISFALNFRAAGRTLLPADFRLVNIFLHLMSGLFLYGVLLRTLVGGRLGSRYGQKARSLAGICAALWLVHPLQTESVTYICQRYESMMGFFYMLTIYLFIRAVNADGLRLPLYAGSVIACLLGTGSKEVMITAPVVVLIYDALFVSGSAVKALRTRPLYYAGLCLGWVMLGIIQLSIIREFTPTSAGLRTTTVTTPTATLPSWWNYLLSQAEVIIHYLRLVFVPHPLCIDYYWPEASGLWQVFPWFLALGVTGMITLYLLFRRSPWSFPLAWFFIVLAPSSSIISLSDRAAEHRMYLALAPFLIIVVFLLHEALGAAGRHVPHRYGAVMHSMGAAVAVAAVIVYGGIAHFRNQDYRSEMVMWTDVVAKRPLNPRGHSNLGAAIAGRGDYHGAIPHFREAIRLLPGYGAANNDLGLCLMETGNIDDGLAHCRDALRVADGRRAKAGAHLRIAHGLFIQGNTNEAISHYEDVIDIMGNSRAGKEAAHAHYRLGEISDLSGMTNEAVRHYRAALAVNPEHVPSHNNLGAILMQSGYSTEGIAHLREANRIDPDYAVARQNLGMALLMISRESR